MIAIIGAGPAGLSAAAVAAGKGEEVLLIDSASQLGGQYWRHLPSNWEGGDQFHYDFSKARNLFTEVLNSPLVTRYSGATVWNAEKVGDEFHLFVIRNGIEEKIVASKVILATGAYDRTLPFPGWDLPGSMTPGAAQAMLKSHGVLVGKRIIVAGTGPFLMPVATGLAKAGAEIVGIFDANYEYRWILNVVGLILNPSKIIEGIHYKRELRKFGLKIKQGKRVERFDGKSATVSGEYLECDVVAVGWGFVPELSLAGILGAELTLDRDGTPVVKVNSRQESSIAGLYVAGEATGIGGSALSSVEGQIAGGARKPLSRWRMRLFARGLQRVYPVSSDWQMLVEEETTICRCEEVKRCDLIQSIEELGAEDGRTAKLFTRAGMGLCQGRVCGRNVSEIVASHRGSQVSDDERKFGTLRPIAAPISLGELGDGLEKKF